jgi:hypothetical protein
LRQYVISLPFELRRLAAFRADVARALGRIFIDALTFERVRAEAGTRALCASPTNGSFRRPDRPCGFSASQKICTQMSFASSAPIRLGAFTKRS